MDVFSSLFVNLLPLYAFITAGYVAGRYLKADRQTMASLAIFIFVPVVVFGFVADMDFKPEYTVLPVFYYTTSVVVGLIFFALSKKIYGPGDNHANLTAMCSSMGNAGYFGLPLVLLLFEKDIVAIYIFMMLGGNVYEATFGYYYAARSNFSVRDSMKKLLQFPAIYALAAGFMVNALDLELPQTFWINWAYVKGAYVVTGMMIIGCALAGVNKLVLDPKFTALVFTASFYARRCLGHCSSGWIIRHFISCRGTW